MSQPNRPFCLLTVVGLAAACAHAAGTVSPERARIEPDQALAHVRRLASDEWEGRGVKTVGLRKAADYIAEQFRQDGLEPLGDNGGYLQWFQIAGGGKVLGGAVELA